MTDLLHREEEIREYFGRPGTVSAWWYPEKSAMKHYFAHQTRIFDSIVMDVLAKEPARVNEPVLDVCTGRGRFAIRLGQLGFRNIHAVDLSEEMLTLAAENARRQGLDIHLRRDSAESLDTVEDGSISLISLVDAFDHIPNTDAALRAIARKLRPGGLLIGTFVNSRSLYGLGFSLYRRFLGRSQMIAQVFSPADFTQALRSNGLAVERQIGLELLNFPHDRIPVLKWLFKPFHWMGRIEGALFPAGYRSPLLALHSVQVIFLARRQA